MSKKSDSHSETVKIRDLDNDSLVSLSNRMRLALSEGEMSQLRSYFTNAARDPTDVEIQAMAQAWSEHCCYKSSRFYLKKFLSGLRNDSVILAMEDDAGVVEFDDSHAYVLKMESHNHPSAVEPYGGAATGVGGIIRDILCMGAQPVAVLDSLYFGDPSFAGDDAGSHSTRFLADGIVRGIRDYGNRLGIPTVAGSVYFHESYNRNPLVNAGCVGIIRKSDVIRSRVSKPGEIMVLVGGRTGRDGIHGVNFASRSLEAGDKESSKSVQLGNPIIEEPLIHAMLELVDQKLITGMKDLGGGGLSSAAGEMFYAAGLSGTIDLDRVLMKEEGMKPWEIWVSESQERMLVSMDPGSLERSEKIFRKWDLDYSVIGSVKEGDNLVLNYRGEKVLDLPLSFLTSGPTYVRNYHDGNVDRTSVIPEEPKDYNAFLEEFLRSPNVCSRFRIVREYDRTVRGSTIVSAETGYHGFASHSDSAVIKPLPDSDRGLVLTSGCKVLMTEADPYTGSLISLAEAAKNILCSGGRPHSLVDSLNFGDPENPQIMGELVSSLRAIGDFGREMNTPVVAGNVSLYNRSGEVNIVPTPTFMMVGIIDDINKIVTPEFKENGSHLFMVGRIMPTLNGSEYLRHRGYESPGAPFCDLKELKAISGLMGRLTSDSLILSAHDVSTGGLLVALCEMAFGSKTGAEIDLSEIQGMRTSVKMFSEGGNAIILEVREGDRERFLKECGDLNPTYLGKTSGNTISIQDNGLQIVNSPVSRLREIWSTGLENVL
ncbi:MAG: phosphoribosylformylglycinamidine synthase subunit PurL [Thermoplasmataceae archaeon]